MSIIMRATLHDRAPNTYSGQWPGEKPLFPGLESPAIAHHELVASARVVTFGVLGPRFHRESLAAALEICVSTKKKNLRAWRGRRGHETAGRQQPMTKPLEFSASDAR
jgi:hypothetical protein